MAAMTQDKGVREIEILVRLSFTEGVLTTLLNMLGAMEQQIEPRDR